MRRRTLLALPLGAGAAGLVTLASCGKDVGVRTPTSPQAEQVAYGEDPSQFGELYLPDQRAPRGVVVVIHGGFWMAEYDAGLGRPLAEDLAARGWAAWNLEYRRVGAPESGGGGGAPSTFDDVAAGIAKLTELGLDLTTVVTLGHSAGGHLAVWAASAGIVTAAISQAGVLDLRAAHADGLGDGAVARFLGHPPTAADDRYDPITQVPLSVPVWCIHGVDDVHVPITQSEAYVEAATAAGGRAELLRVEGDHFVVIDTSSAAWQRTLGVLDSLG